MARHIFNFEGGGYLTTMGATWFVSYSYYCHIDKSHKNWKKVSTCPSRVSVFDRTGTYHKFWLQQILFMDDRNLNTNKISLDAKKTKEMARILLEKH
jgi:hypothetical protein